MIEAAISHVVSELNGYLQRQLDSRGNDVVMSSLVEHDGAVPHAINNKLVVLLVNVEKDPTPRRDATTASGSHVIGTYPPLYLNLYLLVAANFSSDNYAEALRFVGDAAGFFQRRPLMDHTNSPGLDPRIDRLVMEIENLRVPELSNLWSILGGRYLPSILYKVRMVTIDADDIRSRTPGVRTPAMTVSG